jgi:thiamine biosynthesis lipoprotein
MIHRRRMLTILAGAAVLPVPGMAGSGVREWRGVALGADARIILDHPRADALIEASLDEVARLEAIFSLYRTDSELSVLNREGVLAEPAFEMLELLTTCGALHARTRGAFDPTIQPLWALHAEGFARGAPPGEAEIERTLQLVGWQNVTVSPEAISLARPGMALTLNGIAQGYIADRVARLLRHEGVDNVLVKTGEISALGVGPDGGPWQIGLEGGNGKVALSDAALATSAPLATVFDEAGRAGHIIDPRSGRPGGLWRQVSVLSWSAAEADGLSTAFCLMNREEIEAARGDSQIWLG